MALRLKTDLFATTTHGITGQDVSEGILEAGTLIKDVVTYDDRRWHFLASTDDGRSWFNEVSLHKPEIEDV